MSKRPHSNADRCDILHSSGGDSAEQQFLSADAGLLSATFLLHTTASISSLRQTTRNLSRAVDTNSLMLCCVCVFFSETERESL